MCGRTPSTARSGSGHGSGMASSRPEPAQANTPTVCPGQSRAHGGNFSSTVPVPRRQRLAAGRLGRSDELADRAGRVAYGGTAR